MTLPNIISNYIARKDFQTDSIGKSDARVYVFEDIVLKMQPISEESENELQMMRWLNGKISVPSIIEHICESGFSYLIMTKCTGQMSCAERYMKNPIEQAELIAGALHQVWNIPTEDCPCNWSIEKRLQQASKNVISGNVNVADAQPNTFGSNGFKSPEHLLNWLIDNKPTEAQVVSHGDFCMPNIFVNDTGLTGLIDLGKAGVADKWQDIAICYRSLLNNYSGVYNGIKYAGFQDRMLFDALEMEPDWDRIRYYILLDELF